MYNNICKEDMIQITAYCVRRMSYDKYTEENNRKNKENG